MIRFDDILEKLSSNYAEKDITLLKKAYVFSARAHKGQIRRSGEPYLSHPLEVTKMLADLNMDKTALVAGLLHDVLEDTDVTASELKDEFGKDIAALVEGVTKISRVQAVSPEVRRAETIRKIILAMTDDLRVIFIKLADRLHNLKTLKFLSEEKQMQIARETLEIYAPIANRLGMGRIKAELEDFAFRYVEPEEYFRVASLVEPLRKKAEFELKKFKKILEHLMKENHIPAEIYYRIKRLYSIHMKMKAQHIDFSQVYDFMALRIITDSVKNCYAALGILHQRWPPIPYRFRDFIAMPKPNLYQALHTTIITEDKQSFEIQIRTKEMNNIAENGIASHWRYKEDEPQALMKEDKRLLWLREIVELYKEQKDPMEFLKNIKIDLVPEEVYVFSPKGKVISLPMGASALDFAFKIHTEIGLHSAGAKINGNSSPLKTLLKTGDIVEIITSPEKTPNRSWLNIAFTSSARHHIKRWLNLQAKRKSIVLGKKLWEKERKKYTLPSGLLKEETLLKRVAEITSFRIRDIDEFYGLIGLGKIIANKKWMEKFFPSGTEKSEKEAFLHKFVARVTKRPASEIQVKDGEEELVHLAKCCSPIKGEPVIGYITSGKGITVHSRSCPFITKEILDSERMVEVTWGSLSQKSYKGRLMIHAADSPGVLAQVTTAISQRGGNIRRAEVTTSADKKAQIKLDLLIRDMNHLESIIKDISIIKEIYSVARY
ncbi:MAG: bifunctional (p)ppGpp synthetase/guanosine-3',5'-bis(diphosphate) 3'-pyrophosphohydrolase [Candidatus Aminicenantales bacterium]